MSSYKDKVPETMLSAEYITYMYTDKSYLRNCRMIMENLRKVEEKLDRGLDRYFLYNFQNVKLNSGKVYCYIC